MQLRITDWDHRVHPTLLIRHDFDTDWLLLALEENERDTLELAARLEFKALEFSKESMSLPDQTNRYSFGKLHLHVKGLEHVPNLGKLFFRVKLGPFSLETRRLKGPTKDRYKVG